MKRKATARVTDFLDNTCDATLQRALDGEITVDELFSGGAGNGKPVPRCRVRSS